MSLFEDNLYQWRETYFVLFEQSHRPSAELLVDTLQRCGQGLQISDVLADDEGRIESLTIRSPDDYSAMDISYVEGEEVTEQVAEISVELSAASDSDVPKSTLARLPKCSSRLDVYHFQQTVDLAGDDEDTADLMDPGALLSILEYLAQLCHGIVIDPQSGILC